MNRISQCFAQLKTQHKKALVPYIMAGDPQRTITLPLMHALVEAGADILELGIPFSDPMADGPIIQMAAERALAQGVQLVDVLAMVKTFRQKDKTTAVVLMGYLNPIMAMGYREFVMQAQAVGVDGVLIVDLPPEEAIELETELKNSSISMIYLVAPTTTEKRMQLIAQKSSGYLYYVSLKGVTGAGHIDISQVEASLQRMRHFTNLPICVGFGIKDAASAQAIAGCAEGIVVGSALIQTMLTAKHLIPETSAWLKTIRSAINAA